MEKYIKLAQETDLLEIKEPEAIDEILKYIVDQTYEMCIIEVMKVKRKLYLITYFIENVFVALVIKGKLRKIKETDYISFNRVEGKVVEIRITT